ncbi:glycosyltransferase family 4 protein [Pseudanabaena sp. UWO310]|uniref:glycosyltransferase family 4 protein n=1 Tax=Pseudanabaena sp. UWO310 TaxID=2480795 RepID=UPI0011611AEA|nr:glycosyltransferase family 1 protein [Pseudanabaena sp. UWO310]TYQ23948.1 glycosyltransferase family 4 protein [Pseudanabaena sp. UWO310]
MSIPNLALVFNFPQNNSLSMNFCSEMLLHYLQQNPDPYFNTAAIIPEHYYQILTRIPWLGKKFPIRTLDAMFNHFYVYPRAIKKRRDHFDYFHICDHSYANVVHDLPKEKTGVFCHDLDAFRSLLEPDKYPRSWHFNQGQKRVLAGMQKAKIVFYTTQEVRQEIEKYQLLDPQQLVQAPLGIASEFTAIASKPSQVLASVGQQPYLLSISSNQVRKRLDILLQVFAGIHERYPELKLVRVGAEWTPPMQKLIQSWGIGNSIIRLQGLERSELAELYRQATITLVTSESEGFGLPVIEALACGSPVVASDIPVLREVGGNAVTFCPLDRIDEWVTVLENHLQVPSAQPTKSDRLAQAAKYSWTAHAKTISDAYEQLSKL